MTAPFPIGVDGQPVQMDRGRYGVMPVTTPAVALSLSLVQLSDDETALVNRLAAAVTSSRFHLQLRDAYYHGTVRIRDLGISIPPQMRSLHTALGWPRVGVEAIDERLDLQGFRYPNSTDVDSDLQAMFFGNGLDSEHGLANLDAQVFGKGYVAVGSDPDADMPLITVESPLDIATVWNPRTRKVETALRLLDGGATLYTLNETVHLSKDQNGWVVEDRDQHGLGACLMTRISNRPRSYDRDGSSEITTEIMSLTDAACRTLQGLEVAREFFSAPQRYVLGADETAFQDAEGNAKTAWDTYLGRVLALERDEDGQIPTVGQFTPYDPSTFTKVIEMYARLMSAVTGLPPHILGWNTDNPASADAIRSSEMRLKLKADRKTRMFGAGWREVMRLALLVANDGTLPEGAAQISAVWADTATPTPAATTDSLMKQVQMGYLPATSDVTGEKLGYSPLERQRIEADRQHDQGTSFLAEVAHSLVTKDASADARLATTLTPPASADGN